MSTTAVSAGQIMDRVANLLNDPNKTDYTYTVQIPYLNMAIEEYSDLLSDAHNSFAIITSVHFTTDPLIVPAGISYMVSPEDHAAHPEWPAYPPDMIEIQEIGERVPETGPAGVTGTGQNPFRRLPRVEFGELYPATNSLLFWSWERGVIRFNRNGATIPMEVQIKYLFQGINYVATANDIINVIGSRTYLAYKTAAFCAMFIGENETRAKVLETRADEAVERAISIGNKGRQEIMTRHKPFRAGYKMRGWV